MNDVSILVPIYNVELYLERCLVSLFEQTYKSIEYVFVNDASTDNSISILHQIIDKYPDRKGNIKLINHKTNKGLAAARRSAIENSSSPYLLHIDSDDYIDRDMVQKMYEEVVLHNADLVLSNIVVEYKKSNAKIYMKDVTDKWEYLSMVLRRKTPCNIWGRLIKRDIIIKNQIFAESGINQGEDYQVFPKIVYYANNIRVVNSSYFYNRLNQSSYTNNITKYGISEIIQSQRILNSFFEKENKISYNLINESCVYTKLSLYSISDYSNYFMIDSSFPGINYKDFDLKYFHKIVLFLIDHKFYKLTYCLTRLFLLLFRP